MGFPAICQPLPANPLPNRAPTHLRTATLARGNAGSAKLQSENCNAETCHRLRLIFSEAALQWPRAASAIPPEGKRCSFKPKHASRSQRRDAAGCKTHAISGTSRHQNLTPRQSFTGRLLKPCAPRVADCAEMIPQTPACPWQKDRGRFVRRARRAVPITAATA